MSATLEVYLVRHAIAAERGDEWPDDTQRPLTREGIARFERAVVGLRRLDVELDLVLTSPLVRARQTAKLLAEGLRKPVSVKLLDALAPGTPPADVVGAMNAATRRHRVALVGHEPDLGTLAAFLVGSERPMAFKKGGVCRIDLPREDASARGMLMWFAPPKLLRVLGSG